jgi:hypothetical protein
LEARTHQIALPEASVTPGLTVHVPAPDAHDAAAAENVVEIRGSSTASLTHS